MTATDELRKLLDERGVEWWAEDDQEEPAYYFVTKWFANGCEQTYEEIPAIRSRSLKAYCVAPEQAIAATLGGGECENVAPDYLDFLCSVCGFVHYHSDENDTGDGNDWAYCPRCGKAVKR